MGTATAAVTGIADPARQAAVVEVEDLTDVRDGRTVLDGVSLTVAEGEIVTLLDRDGAGATAVVEAVVGDRAPHAGTVRVLGHDPVADRATVRELVGVQLQPAVAGSPPAVVLDDPTAGLDPASRGRTWDLVRVLRDRGAAVLLTTRDATEAERLADRVALLDRGRLVGLDTTRGLVRDAGLEQRLQLPATAALDVRWIRRLPEVSTVVHDQGELVATGDERMLFSLVSLLAAHDIVPGRLCVHQPTLGDAVAVLTRRTLDDRGTAT